MSESTAKDSQSFKKIDPTQLTNVAQLLEIAAQQVPDHTAVAVAGKKRGPDDFHWDSITYAQLDLLTSQIARGLSINGIPKGSRLAVLVKPGIEFVAIVFGLMRAGMVQVLIDPGMGRKNMIRCLSSTNPDGFVAIPAAQIVRRVLARRFPNARHNVTVGSTVLAGGISYRQLIESGKQAVEIPTTSQDDDAAIIFTTGSTGPPKGVSYSHRMFIHQATQIRDFYEIQPGGVDISGFPLFALFNIGMGTTTVIPKMDPTRPAKVHPPNIINAVKRWKATQSFGSPALWNTVSVYGEKHGTQMPTLKRVFSAGAPVPPHVIRRVKKMLSDGAELHTPYGATESLPIASNYGDQILQLQQASRVDAGTCVGKKFSGIQWRIIKIDDGPIANIADTVELECGQIGELMVTGPVVSPKYVTEGNANQLHKVQDGQRIWHRMGDVGYLDTEERFWFCGRKAHRVQNGKRTWFSIPTEAFYNQHPAVYRSALVGVGKKQNIRPAIIVEPWKEKFPETADLRNQLIDELRQLGLKHGTDIQDVLLIRDMPVDIRHNSKIFREKLAVWAAMRLPKS